MTAGRTTQLLFVGVGLVYLAAEVWLNLSLLAAGGMPAAQRASTLQWLLPAGRLLSGLGLTLVLARLLNYRQWLGAALATAVAGILSFPSMWYVQATLLDHLADASSGAQRRSVFRLNLLAPAQAVGVAPAASPYGWAADGTDRLVFALAHAGTQLERAEPAEVRRKVTRYVQDECRGEHCACRDVPAGAALLPGSVPSSATFRRCVLGAYRRTADARYADYERAAHTLQLNCSWAMQDTGTCSDTRDAIGGNLPIDRRLSREELFARSGAGDRLRRELRSRGLLEESAAPACRQFTAYADDSLVEICIRQPLLRRIQDKAVAQFDADPISYVAGDAAASGRQAYRQAIAMPVALGFSLVFTAVNAVLLVFGGARLILDIRGRLPCRASGWLVLQLATLIGVLLLMGAGPADDDLDGGWFSQRPLARWLARGEPRFVGVVGMLAPVEAVAHSAPPQPVVSLLRWLNGTP